MRLASFILLLSAPALLANPPAPNTPSARELDVAGLRLPPRFGRFTDPTKITSLAELARAVPDGAAQAAIIKQVNFKNECVLLFAWSGSGRDRLSVGLGKGKKGPEEVFTLHPGNTLDLRAHVKLFALPKTATYRIQK
jgi:hypothetical protein